MSHKSAPALRVAGFVSLMFVLSIGVVWAGGAPEAGGAPRVTNVSFATSGQGGTFYVAGSGIAAVVNERVPSVQVTAEVTRGVVENARLMASDQSEMGFVYGSTAYEIQRGIGDFQGQQWDGLRAVAYIHAGALNFVTLERTGIRTMNGMVGKRVSIGPQGSGSAAVAEQFFRSVGLWDQIQIQNLSFNDSAAALRDGHLDAFVIGGTTPVPAVVELEAGQRVVFIPVEDAMVEKFLTDFPYHVRYVIPVGGGYSSVQQPIQTVGYTVLWASRADVSADVIYNMVKTVFSQEGRAYLQNVQAAFREMEPGVDVFRRIEFPLHEGAARYFREIGATN